MGKKGTKKRTKWQALPMEEAGGAATAAAVNGDTSAAVAVGFKKFRDFSTYNGDNSYKTAVLGAQKGYNNHHHYSARQYTTNGMEYTDLSAAGDGRGPAPTHHNGGGGYLTEQDQNCQTPSEYDGVKSATTTSSSTTTAYPTANGHGGGGGGYYNNHRYNRDYPTATGRHHFSSSSAAAHYKAARYQQSQTTGPNYNHYPSRDSNSVHSSYSASHHKNSGASSTTSSTTSSSYRNYDNSWRSSRNSHFNHRPHYNGYNKENSGYASNKGACSGNDEYTRITTPRQDVLFKKGYLSRPKRMSAMEEGYLGAPLISQAPQTLPNGDPNVLLPPGDNPSSSPAEVDPQQGVINEDNSPLYFCPGFVDHNGFFHANPTFMPNSYDQFGQPIVIMPYGPPQPVPAPQAVPLDCPAPFENSDNATGAEEENQPVNEEEVVKADEIAATESELAPQPETKEAQEDIQPEEEIISPVAMEPEQQELQTIEPPNEAINPITPIEVEPHEVPLVDGSASAPECPELSADRAEVIEGEQSVNTPLPLDPASNSFYPQSAMYPYYPMVFTPQQLPPNTSIIPLADLYYNENYAGLAAEIFGLTEPSSIQSDDSSAAAVPPCDVVDEDQLSAGIVAAPMDVGEPLADMATAAVDGGNNAALPDEKTDSVDGAIADGIIAQPPTSPVGDQLQDPEPLVEQIQIANAPVPPPSPIVQIENAAEVVANSNLKVDVAEFHPRIPNYPIVEQPTTVVPNHKPYRPSAPYYNHHNHPQDQYPRRRQDDRQDDYRRRRYADNQTGGPNNYNNNRPPRRTFNNSGPATAAATNSPVSKDEEKKPERSPAQNDKQVTPPPQPPTAQKTIQKAANKTPNSKRAIQESIKHIAEQNIDLSRTSIAAAVQSSQASADSNQWLVKTKGKKKRAATPIDIPADDMFEHEEEETTADVAAPVVEITPEVIIVRAPTPVVEEAVDKASEKTSKESKTPLNKQKKSPNGKSNNSPATKVKGKNSGNKKSKTPNGKGSNAGGTKGFEVIEPDFGVITRLKTEPISLDPDLEEELENILNMKDIEEEPIRPLLVEEEAAFRKSTSLPKSPRSEKDNIIDLDDLEALERSLMDFDLSGELKERMIEIIQSELEAPLGDTEQEEEEKEIEACVLVVESLNSPQKEEEIPEIILPEEEIFEEIATAAEEILKEVPVELKVEELSQEETVIVTEPLEEVLESVSEEDMKADEENQAVLNNPAAISAEDQLEQTELKIITSGISVDEHCTGSSSSSSSLSSPIPTEDGRDGSNSESDDMMTPPPTPEEEQEKKMVLPSQLEGRLFSRELLPADADASTKESSVESDTTEVPDIGITASVSKWLEEKEKECSPEPIFRIPDDPQVAKLIFKAMYGVDLALGEDEDEEFETEDDMDSLSADESDFETDARDALKYLLSGGGGRGQSGGGKRDNQVPIDTDSDYMSDGQNIKPADVQSAGAANGKLPSSKPPSSAADATKTSAADSQRSTRSKMCKVM